MTTASELHVATIVLGAGDRQCIFMAIRFSSVQSEWAGVAPISDELRVRDLGALGAAEPRMSIDMMRADAPGLAAPLAAIWP
ncbi:hypothetical protein WMF18_23495 [Sorangium sp. So ce315]|uniref:hypothetical protein n=1 Tax=Sorangium sp. So ce315 TaxID=3133299 RepID=UPI003F5EF685